MYGVSRRSLKTAINTLITKVGTKKYFYGCAHCRDYLITIIIMGYNLQYIHTTHTNINSTKISLDEDYVGIFWIINLTYYLQFLFLFYMGKRSKI